MSLNRHDDRCPKCGHPDPTQQGTVEGGFGGAQGADTALLMCANTACRFVWDTEMTFPESPHWPLLTIVRAIQTCAALPSQWDAWTASGQYLYLRYRHGRGTVDTYDNPDSDTWEDLPEGALARFGVGWQEHSYDGEIELAEFCAQAGLILAADAEIS